MRSGGAFANTPAEEPQRPQQRSAAQPARPALRRRLDLREDIAAAQDVDAPTAADDEHEVRPAATHVRRYAKPKILEVPGDDGLWRAIFGGHATTEPVVICVCERCGYGRPATDLETPFSNGIGEPHYNMTFGEGMYAQGAPIPLKQPTFICKRCPRYGSRPYGVGGARRIAPPAPEIAIAAGRANRLYEAPPIVEPPEDEARRKFWAQQAENRKNPDFQMALKQVDGDRRGGKKSAAQAALRRPPRHGLEGARPGQARAAAEGRFTRVKRRGTARGLSTPRKVVRTPVLY